MIEHIVTIDSEVALPTDVTEPAITSLVQYVLQQENLTEPWEIGIQFVDDPTMQAAHIEFMDIDEPTDIMTFPYADDEFGDDAGGGDLLISVDRAAANAEDAGWSRGDEVLFVVIHGLLHLTGWDDHSDEDRAAMLERQRELLESWPDRN